MFDVSNLIKRIRDCVIICCGNVSKKNMSIHSAFDLLNLLPIWLSC